MIKNLPAILLRHANDEKLIHQFKKTSSAKIHPLSPLPLCHAGSLLTGFKITFTIFKFAGVKFTS